MGTLVAWSGELMGCRLHLCMPSWTWNPCHWYWPYSKALNGQYRRIAWLASCHDQSPICWSMRVCSLRNRHDCYIAITCRTLRSLLVQQHCERSQLTTSWTWITRLFVDVAVKESLPHVWEFWRVSCLQLRLLQVVPHGYPAQFTGHACACELHMHARQAWLSWPLWWLWLENRLSRQDLAVPIRPQQPF